MPTMMLAEKNYMHCFHFSMIFFLIFCSFLRYPWWLSVIIFAMPAHALRFPRHKSKLAAFTEHAWLTTPLAVSLASCVNHRSGVCLSVCPLACVSPIVHRVLLWILTVSAASEHLRLHLLPVAMPGGGKPVKGVQSDPNYVLQESQLSQRDRAMRRVNWNLANCHATVQKLFIQVLTKSMVWSWRFSRRQCVIDNVHSTMTRPSRLPLSQVS